jgi:hypothetical protein
VPHVVWLFGWQLPFRQQPFGQLFWSHAMFAAQT